MNEALGKPVVIDNRGGASGSIGGMEAARAALDGYRWLLPWDTEVTDQTTMRLLYRVMQAYRGGGPAIQAVLSRDLPLLVTPIPGIRQHIKAGTVRLIAVSSEGEARHLPEMKSYAQQGLPGFEAPT